MKLITDPFLVAAWAACLVFAVACLVMYRRGQHSIDAAVEREVEAELEREAWLLARGWFYHNRTNMWRKTFGQWYKYRVSTAREAERLEMAHAHRRAAMLEAKGLKAGRLKD